MSDQPPTPDNKEPPADNRLETILKTNVYFPSFRRLRDSLRSWPIFGILAGTAWFLILAIGVLVPSEDYRKILGWIPETSEKLEDQNKLVKSVKEAIKDSMPEATIPPAEVKTGSSLPAPALQGANPPPNGEEDKRPAEKKNKDESSERKCTHCGKLTSGDGDFCYRCKVEHRTLGGMICPFFVSAVSFLPLNICLLTILAAFIGGCAINKGELQDLGKLVEEHNAAATRTAEADRDRKRYNYLREHPGYSALRGLIVFLVIVSGLLLAGGTSIILDGTQTEQLTQYFRMAGLFSFFGYLAGSDPTMFASMIEFGSARIRQSGTTTPQPQPPPPAAVDDAVAAAAAAAAAAKIAADSAADRAADTVDAVNAVGDAVEDENDDQDDDVADNVDAGGADGGDGDGPSVDDPTAAADATTAPDDESPPPAGTRQD